VFLALSVVFAANAIPVGIHKGIDVEIHINAAQLLLDGRPLYTEAPGIGVWWPPFAIAALTPFALIARLSMPVAKGLYSLVSIVCLVWTIARLGRSGHPHLATAIAAVAVPLQTNFDYLNVNAILLVLIVTAAFDLERGRDARAGIWLGLATTLKAFPVLLLVYLAFRRRWTALAWGAGCAVVLSAGALLPAGIPEAVTSAQHWFASSAVGVWVAHPRNQSLPALLGRFGLPAFVIVIVQLGLVGLVAVALRRPGDPLSELGIVALLMVLVSPLAWEHYYLLALPAWVVALARVEERAVGRSIALFAAGIATSGALTVWSGSLRGVLLEHSIYAWGALALLAALIVDRIPGRAAPDA
jgi:alpha-1,2-mannosyltransferase